MQVSKSVTPVWPDSTKKRFGVWYHDPETAEGEVTPSAESVFRHEVVQIESVNVEEGSSNVITEKGEKHTISLESLKGVSHMWLNNYGTNDVPFDLVENKKTGQLFVLGRNGINGFRKTLEFTFPGPSYSTRTLRVLLAKNDFRWVNPLSQKALMFFTRHSTLISVRPVFTAWAEYLGPHMPYSD